MEKRLFTSESVTEGHPDKICDAISDAILDALMEKDPMSRVACETAITTGMVLVMGEITTNAYIDMQQVVRETIKEIGYDNGDYGFDAHTCAVLTAIDEQSADIALGVNKALEAKEHKMSEEELDAIGAGDQGMMFGYACDETNEFMPYPISLAHKLTRQLTQVRKDGLLNYLRPDGKSQVTVEYDEAGIPHRLDAVVLSTQHVRIILECLQEAYQMEGDMVRSGKNIHATMIYPFVRMLQEKCRDLTEEQIHKTLWKEYEISGADRMFVERASKILEPYEGESEDEK